MDVRDSTSESLETFRNIEDLAVSEPSSPFEASSFVRSFVRGGREERLYWLYSNTHTRTRFRRNLVLLLVADGSVRLLLCSVASRADVVVKEPAASNGLCPRLSTGFNYSGRGRGIRSLVSLGRGGGGGCSWSEGRGVLVLMHGN